MDPISIYSGWATTPFGGAAYRTRLLVSLASQSIERNGSLLSWHWRIEKDRSFEGYNGYGPNGRSVVIDGSTRLSGNTSDPDSTWPGTSSWTLGSGTYEVEHDPDGTKEVTVSAVYSRSPNGWAPGTMSLSRKITLPPILRGPQFKTPTGFQRLLLRVKTPTDFQFLRTRGKTAAGWKDLV